MKQCPECQRTYGDDSITFCLADGALLSAPYDPLQSSQHAKRHVDPPPTVIMHPPPKSNALPPTQPAAQVQDSTLVANPHLTHKQPPASTVAEWSTSSRVPWIIGGIVAVFIVGAALAILLVRQSATSSTTPAPSPTIASSPTSPASSPISTETSKDARQPTVGSVVGSKTPANPPARSPGAAESLRPTAPISGGNLTSKAISLPKPAYPPIARAAHASGTVVVQITVDENGSVISARAISGHPLLQAASIAAARAARFSPTKLSGQAVKVNGTVSYRFEAQ